ncbi:mechanosensitive ion channel family protein [Shewanella sp. NIFS-20-20]|uniref:mechanosensitive ion channel family protein n=1 Tax=Shewanella sp. NIFS-20-20 TaxID=2853806 RepID=UPI001C44519D|nr:mechanosensitive ion channel family protein [Shewanella sp. NIFS-20-20]MBV7316193.1 mechanosensitive ion channel family protein [Shewanella sp. NIFS-20-20]
MPKASFRIMSLLLLLVISCSRMVAAEPDSTDANTASLQQIHALQQRVDNEVVILKSAQGELRKLTEFTILSNIKAIRGDIQKLMAQADIDKATTLPLINQQFDFLNRINTYLNNDINDLKQKLDTNNDQSVLLQIANRQSERDIFFEAQLQTLDWAKQLGENTDSQQQQLSADLLVRGHKLASTAEYIQQQLKLVNNEISAAGKDVPAHLVARHTTLNEWLNQSTSSLNVTITLLDSMGDNTADLKKVLFSVSGDLTQGLINADVAKGLLEQWFGVGYTQLVDNGPSFVFKLVIFSLILMLAMLFGRLAETIVKRAVSNSRLKFSQLLQDFFIKLSGKVVFTIGLLIALSQLGIELGPLLAGFGIAGVIIGFALQDTLSNFASGMMILIYRPFDVGDLINAAGVTGKVSHMTLVSTTIMTFDNQRLIIPNNKIWGDTINNITAERERRVDLVFGIGYSDDIPHAEKVLMDIISTHPKVLKHPEPLVKLHTLNNSSVDFVVRPWTRPEDYWDVYWDVTRAVKIRFDEEGITIPFPQRDVHIYHQDSQE